MVSLKRWSEAQRYEQAWWASAAQRYRRDPNRGSHYSWRASELERLVGGLFDENRKQTARVLEVGSGPLGIVSCLGWGELYALDPLEEFFRSELPFVARRRPGVQYIKGMGESIPFKDGSFWLVICDNVLDHCQEPSLVLDEIHRVLADEGVFCLAVNVHATWGALLHSLLAILHIDRGHPHTFTPSRVRALMRRHRFVGLREGSTDYYQARDSDRASAKLKDKLKGYVGVSEFVYQSVWSKESPSR